MRKNLLLLFSVFCLIQFSNSGVFAQGVTTASFIGLVKDNRGPLPGATVVAIHVPSGTKYVTATRADGRYNLPDVRVGGPYTVRISFVGLNDYMQDNITTTLGQELRVDATLTEATKTLKEVTVASGQNQVFDESRTGARQTITRQQIDRLPTVNRSLQDFTRLTPSANGLNFGGRSSNFNNLTVDGALFNNSFGLSGTLGGQTNSQPISLDAIEQIQVDIAPYDVRQGFFTGAGINTVVRSGTNNFRGTIYGFTRGVSLTGYHAGLNDIAKTPFTYNQRGASIGGPIIKNKLFFFASGEQERSSLPGTSYTALQPGQTAGGTISQADATTLDAISAYLKSKYNYDPGLYQGYNYHTYSDKATVKIDWNINDKNTLSAKYFYLKSYRESQASSSGITNAGVGFGTSRAPSLTTLPFFGSGYQINNNFNIGIVELNSRISNTISNKLTAGYSALRDYRNVLGSSNIPMVDIGNGVGSTSLLTSFGYELYSAGNLLSTNTTQLSDDLTFFAGKHEIVVGTSNQLNKYVNGFAPDYNGLYTFNSASDFLTNQPAAAYTVRNSALPSGQFPYANLSAYNLSFYAQDRYNVAENFKLTYGVRADYNYFPVTTDPNPNVAALTFQQGIKLDVSHLPKNRVLFSPRVGFNWDVNGDKNTQVRGGTGVFTGLVPYVWISNQLSNTGVLFGSYTVTKAAAPNDPRLLFNPNTEANRPAVGTAQANTSYEVDATSRDFKYPQIFRTNLAVDQKLPFGIIGTIEGAYTKDINAVYHQNIALSDTYTTLPGVEGQIRYTARSMFTGNTVTNPSISPAIYMSNTNRGFSYFITGQLQKNFTNGLYANVAYTYSRSKDVNDGGSTASTIWSSRPVVGDPNSTALSNSSYVQPNRVIAALSYKKDYLKHGSTSIGIFFEAANNGAISYITSGDPNNDGATNDLLYIPKNQSDIIMVKDYAADPRTADQQWAELDAFIKQDPYLSKHRGEYAQRNGAILPYFKRADLNITQDFYIDLKNGKRNTLEISFNMINLGNFLNPNWGLYQTTYNGFTSGTISLLAYKGIDPASGRATYSFPYQDRNNLIPVTTSFRPSISLGTTWQAQIGARYIFN